jgi:hypothetical protein
MTTVCAEAGTAMQIAAAAAIAKAIFFICPPPEQIRAFDADNNVPRSPPFRKKCPPIRHFFSVDRGTESSRANAFIILCANDHKEVLRSVMER